MTRMNQTPFKNAWNLLRDDEDLMLTSAFLCVQDCGAVNFLVTLHYFLAFEQKLRATHVAEKG